MPGASQVSNFEELLNGSCLGCRLPFAKRKCEHWLRVRVALQSARGMHAFHEIDQACASLSDPNQLWKTWRSRAHDFLRLAFTPASKESEMLYCALAQRTESLEYRGTPEQKQLASKYKQLLHALNAPQKEN
jgi:hypothetical protein